VKLTMKINRLLGIVVYLLNRETVSGRVLAGKFEVSARTIQRDIEAISLAGIPVGSLQGLNGGYYIMDSFKMNRQLLQPQDYAYILAALRGFVSGYDSRQAQDTVEKMVALSPDNAAVPQAFQLNLGVLQEGVGTGESIAVLERAIREKHAVQFLYTNAHLKASCRRVEPLLLTYKWYAWYLFAYCCEQEDYRLFRLSRMRDILPLPEPFTSVHRDAELLLAGHGDNRVYLNIKLLCPVEYRVLLEEALPNARLLETRGQKLVMGFTVPGEEQGWFGIILQHSHQVTVLEPESLREKLLARARMILDTYS
jgi:predicted DNA-binding transcriptional regulator YafY